MTKLLGPNARDILKRAGGQWDRICLQDLLGMVTGKPYERQLEPPNRALSPGCGGKPLDGKPVRAIVSRWLVGLGQDEQISAMQELLRRPEREEHLPAIFCLGEECPLTCTRTAEAFILTWTEGIPQTLARLLAESLRAHGEHARQQFAAFCLGHTHDGKRLPIPASELDSILPALHHLAEQATAYDSKTLAARALTRFTR